MPDTAKNLRKSDEGAAPRARAPSSGVVAPDLSALTREQASALERIAIAAAIHFTHLESEARERHRRAVRDNARPAWIAEAASDLERAQRNYRAALLIERAANRRARIAGREECAAVRVIEAFAHRALTETPRRAAA
jgi:hypothetical protein